MYMVLEDKDGRSKQCLNEKDAQELYAKGWTVRIDKSNFKLEVEKKSKKKK